MKKILNLQCINCGKEYKTSATDFLCLSCGSNLEVNYDYKLISKRFKIENFKDKKRFDMWRYIDLLPVNDFDKLPYVQVGWTPMYDHKELADELGISKLLIKDEGRNPTGSIKDRGSAVSVARALELGLDIIADASTGNASDSLACLTAGLDIKTIVFTTKDAPYPKLTQLFVYGADVFTVDGTYDDAFELCKKAVEEYGWYSRAAGYNPFTREGKKTCSFEICEQLNWEAPDKVLVAVGDGTILSGMWKGFVDFQKLGILEKMPQMIAVQAEGSDAIKRAFENKGEVTAVKAHTIADSILVNYPRDAQLAVQALQESDGYAVTVTDEEILAAIPEFARKANIFAEPAGAAVYAALKKLAEEGKIEQDETVAIVIGGNGLKDTYSYAKNIQKAEVISKDFEAFKITAKEKGLIKTDK
ncbi:Plp-dependent enzyme [Elusimicrobium minutum Pei191]|uniref:Threonine synthase n=1 Tax=Elusimicrobium minutum (strain Pei191) TaxID=445932 RepID=B2KE33_ELUMP|nr:threonine synthase [Elusimicrobium minutum]ACC98779.1 Plp-dependent enzyme [Elusimicrobium minutum Pei191]